MTPLLEITKKTWIVSDTHFGHERIKVYGNRPDDWVERIVRDWMSKVSEDDTVLHLGDLALLRNSNEAAWLHLMSLPGDKWLLRGNHDTHTATFYLNRAGFKVLSGPVIVREMEVAGRGVIPIMFSHRPQHEFKWGKAINIHGHIHNNGYAESIVALGLDHRNVSLEVMDYSVVPLGEVLEGGRFQAPPSLEEWHKIMDGKPESERARLEI